MAHQLDFHVTLWSDNLDQLLEMEKFLQQFEQASPKVGGNNPYKRLHTLASALRQWAFQMTLIRQVDIHSIDINWDDNSPNQPKEIINVAE